MFNLRNLFLVRLGGGRRPLSMSAALIVSLGLGVMLCLVLSGCETTAEQLARENAADDATCKSYGAKAGSDVYVSCRMSMHSDREAKENARRVAAAASGPTVCNSGGGVTYCY